MQHVVCCGHTAPVRRPAGNGLGQRVGLQLGLCWSARQAGCCSAQPYPLKCPPVGAARLRNVQPTSKPRLIPLQAGPWLLPDQFEGADSFPYQSPEPLCSPALLPSLCSLGYGGSQIRPEATGFGTVIFAQAVLTDEVGSLINQPSCHPAKLGLRLCGLCCMSPACLGTIAAAAHAAAAPSPLRTQCPLVGRVGRLSQGQRVGSDTRALAGVHDPSAALKAATCLLIWLPPFTCAHSLALIRLAPFTCAHCHCVQGKNLKGMRCIVTGSG